MTISISIYTHQITYKNPISLDKIKQVKESVTLIISQVIHGIISFPYLLSYLNSSINAKIPLTSHDTLSTQRNVTRMIITYRYDHCSVETHTND